MAAEPLRVAVDGSGLARPLAGIGRYTAQVLDAMRAARPDSSLTVLQAPRRPFLGRHLEFPLAVRRTGADLYWSPSGLLPLGPLGMPAAITVHDLAIYRHPEWFPEGQWLSTKLVVPRSIRKAAALIAVSESTARDLRDLFGAAEDRVTVVHHGVGREFRPLAASQTAELRRRHRLPGRFVLFVSTIEPRKNLETLAEAWNRVDTDAELVVAGGWGWRYEEAKARLETARRVRLLGPVDPGDLPALYSSATCLVHPAWYEGFGLTPLEAMACGTPVVCSDTSSLPEVVGDAAITVDPADAAGLADALERLLEDQELRAELRRRGLERAAGFSWERAAEQTWQVLDRLRPAP